MFKLVNHKRKIIYSEEDKKEECRIMYFVIVVCSMFCSYCVWSSSNLR